MKSCSILIIDDDADDVEILAEAFTQTGVKDVHYVDSAMKAFMYLQSITDKENYPKLIVTDLYLPGISGPEFLADLKTMDKYKNIHVIVLSGSKSEMERARYKSMGALDYIIKPSSYDEYSKVAKDIADRVVH